ncbi:uncharacterized protein B0I36DRAFT_346338 [Microdochium trichocladiopsis]|uniref:Roadblock/LAMTOR2 domain-containing protein n=1 Tax=Microdochium trichocladiopsis TaxID=1682393 RepID=A0A9P9BUN9_9PEZI|nr:uncharacterized protein B0I36DRAFT_346338 [Microdochium trichocladiopsis]KAH7038352.1 hypothetical protein B0I36DRAFT_346338 [Microdochium trichocladiopsis]
MKFSITVAIASLLGASAAAPTFTFPNSTATVDDLFRSLKRAPEGHALLRSDGVVVAFDQQGNVIDRAAASNHAVREYNAKMDRVRALLREKLDSPSRRDGGVGPSVGDLARAAKRESSHPGPYTNGTAVTCN